MLSLNTIRKDFNVPLYITYFDILPVGFPQNRTFRILLHTSLIWHSPLQVTQLAKLQKSLSQPLTLIIKRFG